MRLKGRFRDADSFMRISHAVSRMSSRCILRFSPEEIQIVVAKGIDAVETWAALDDVGSFFVEYRVESNYNNQVNLEVSSEALVHALRSASSPGADATLKLAKRDNEPVLSLEIHSKSGSDHVSQITHHIPIKVKKASDMAGLKTAEESVNSMQVNVVSSFPEMAEIRTVAERMKSADPDKVAIASNRAGQVKLVMSSDAMTMSTTWSGLPLGDDDRMEEEQAEASKRFKNVNVDLKSFVRLLSCQLPEHTTELWMYHRACASFVFHIRSAIAQSGVSAHILVNLPSLGSE